MRIFVGLVAVAASMFFGAQANASTAEYTVCSSDHTVNINGTWRALPAAQSTEGGYTFCGHEVFRLGSVVYGEADTRLYCSVIANNEVQYQNSGTGKVVC